MRRRTTSPIALTFAIFILAAASIVWTAVNTGTYNGYRLSGVPNDLGDETRAIGINESGRVSLLDTRSGKVQTPTEFLVCARHDFALVDREGDICTVAPLVLRRTMTNNGSGILVRRKHIDTILPDPGVNGPDGDSDIISGFSGRFVVLWSLDDQNLEWDGSRCVPLPCPAAACKVESVNISGDAAGLIIGDQTKHEKVVLWHRFRPSIIRFPVSSASDVQYAHSCVIGDDGTLVLSSTGTGFSTKKIFAYRGNRIVYRVKLPAAGLRYDVKAINTAGDFVGTAADLGWSQRAFACHAGFLRFLTPPGVVSDATAINDRGVVAGNIYLHRGHEGQPQGPVDLLQTQARHTHCGFRHILSVQTGNMDAGHKMSSR